jgi:large subunit ribosomal protein L17
MVTSLIKHERIETTVPKAKELRKIADKMVTLAKKGDLHARRKAAGILFEKPVLKKLFDEFGERYMGRDGGYTRIVRTRFRRPDQTPMAYIEYVDRADELRKAQPGKAAEVRGKTIDELLAARARRIARTAPKAARAAAAAAAAGATDATATASSSDSESAAIVPKVAAVAPAAAAAAGPGSRSVRRRVNDAGMPRLYQRKTRKWMSGMSHNQMNEFLRKQMGVDKTKTAKVAVAAGGAAAAPAAAAAAPAAAKSKAEPAKAAAPAAAKPSAAAAAAAKKKL